MENIVKQIQLLALVIILGATVIAFGIEIYQMIEVQKVTLADLLLLFLYLEVLRKSFYHYCCGFLLFLQQLG